MSHAFEPSAPIVSSRRRRTLLPVATPSVSPKPPTRRALVSASLSVFLTMAAVLAIVPAAGAQSRAPAQEQVEAPAQDQVQTQAQDPGGLPASEHAGPAAAPADAPAPAAPAEAPAEPPAVDTAAGVMAADRAMARAVADGNGDELRELLADDATFLSAEGTLHGRDAVVSGWGKLLGANRVATLTWDPQGARVAASRELAYSVGTYTLTVPRSEGEPLQNRGQYITVWTRDAEGGGPWRALFDGPMRRGCAAYLEHTLGEQGRIGSTTGSDFRLVPERRVLAKSDDLSVIFGSYQAQRIDLDGSYHAVAEGSWFSVWATNTQATPDEATRLLPAGDSVTPPQAMPEDAPTANDPETRDE